MALGAVIYYKKMQDERVRLLIVPMQMGPMWGGPSNASMNQLGSGGIPDFRGRLSRPQSYIPESQSHNDPGSTPNMGMYQPPFVENNLKPSATRVQYVDNRQASVTSTYPAKTMYNQVLPNESSKPNDIERGSLAKPRRPLPRIAKRKSTTERRQRKSTTSSQIVTEIVPEDVNSREGEEENYYSQAAEQNYYSNING